MTGLPSTEFITDLLGPANEEQNTEEFKCPWTGDRVQVHIPPLKSADEFCPTCDFPMFWSYAVERRVKAFEVEQRNRNQPQGENEEQEQRENRNRQKCLRCKRGNLEDSLYCGYCGLNFADPVPMTPVPMTPATRNRRVQWLPWMTVAAIVATTVLVLAIYFAST